MNEATFKVKVVGAPWKILFFDALVVDMIISVGFMLLFFATKTGKRIFLLW